MWKTTTKSFGWPSVNDIKNSQTVLKTVRTRIYKCLLAGVSFVPAKYKTLKSKGFDLKEHCQMRN